MSARWKWTGLRLAAGAALVGAACAARAPVTRTGPIDPAADRRLTSLIELRLSSDHRLCPFDVDVATANGVVRLEGLVGSQIDRNRAVKLAANAGAIRVVDGLIVSPASGDGGRC